MKIWEPYYKDNKRTQALVVLLFLTIAVFLSFLVRNEVLMLTLDISTGGAALMAGYARLPLLRRLLENGFVRFIGKHSYAIYLLHYPIIMLIDPHKGFFRRELYIKYAVLAGCLVIGVLFSLTAERYFLKLRERLAPRQVHHE